MHPTTTPDRVPASPPGRDSRRPAGQWAVDGPAPLNDTETVKAVENPLDVRHRIEQTYSRLGFDSVPPDDLRLRFKWWGLYTQRRPGIDGGRTARLEPHELEDRLFMLRVRLDGGQLSTGQVRVLAGISFEFAGGTADISDRQNIQYHNIRIEDVPRIWHRLESAGMGTRQACGDAPRVVLGSPVAGISAEEILDPTPVIEEITDRFLGDPDLANLPRKFKTAVTGHPGPDVPHEINDLSLVGVLHPDLGPGYDPWVGGGLSTQPRLARRLGTFVAPELAAEVWFGVVRLFRDYGYRRLRHRARLKFLVQDWGPQRFREILEREYLGRRLPDGPAPAPPPGGGDHLGVHEQRDGRRYVGFAPVAGRLGADGLAAVAAAAENAGSGRIRLTPQQKLLVLDVPPDRVDALVDGVRAHGLSAHPGPFRRATMACTGLEFCKLAIVETKATAAATLAELDRRLADLDLDPPISLHVNGCPNSCARIQVADIGLKGVLAPLADGGERPAFQVHLGGGLAAADREEAELGRTVRGLRVTAEELVPYVERLVRRYHARRHPGEGFAAWVHRADEGELR